MKEKDNYKELFLSKSPPSISEENLNKTIDYFKLENVKLGENLIKIYNELKKNNETWIKTLKMHIGKFMSYFESVYSEKISLHLNEKFSLLDKKIDLLLNYVQLFNITTSS